MNSIPFPPLVPTSRQYTPGVYAEERFTAQNGAVTRLRYGSRRFNSTLDLAFSNITDDNAALIVQHYVDVMSGDNNATFTSVTDGTSVNLAVWLQEATAGLYWKYTEPPAVDSVQPGRSTVRVSFVGELEGN